MYRNSKRSIRSILNLKIMAETKSKNQRDIIISVLRSKFNDYSDKDLYPTAVLDVTINLSDIRSACKKSYRAKLDPNTKN